MPGSVSHAGWSVSWSIPELQGRGLVLSQVFFGGMKVLHEASQPFVLVPYHGNSPTFKDGLNPACGAVPYTAVLPTAPNAPSSQVPPASKPPNVNDNAYDPMTNPKGVVVVEKEPANFLEPAKLVIWAKLQAANYQYVQKWEFKADGSIEVHVGLAGLLWTVDIPKAGHIHNFYFRLDFDINTATNNLVQEFSHSSNNAGGDVWQDITTEAQSPRTANPATRTRWRVLNKTPKPNGQLRSYELTPGSDGGPDGTYSTGDLWVLRYVGGQDGAAVGCNDTVLTSTYGSGESVNGQDVVVWYCLRHHHQPRITKLATGALVGEETIVVPYEMFGFHMQPRDVLDKTPTNLYPTTPSSPIP